MWKTVQLFGNKLCLHCCLWFNVDTGHCTMHYLCIEMHWICFYFMNILMHFTTLYSWLLATNCILIMRFSYIDKLLHVNLADFPVVYLITTFTLIVMGNSKNLYIFNFAILLLAKYTFYCVDRCWWIHTNTETRNIYWKLDTIKTCY